MRALRTLKVDLSGYLGTALVAVLFASSGTLYAQKNKTAASTPPAKSAPAPTASHAAAPAASHPASGPGFLLDTNIPSEIIRARPDPRVNAWVVAQYDATLHLNAIAIGELRKGLTILPEGKRRSQLQDWLENDVIPMLLPDTTGDTGNCRSVGRTERPSTDRRTSAQHGRWIDRGYCVSARPCPCHPQRQGLPGFGRHHPQSVAAALRPLGRKLWKERKNGLPPIHPGEIIKEDILPSTGLSVTAAAKALGVSRQMLHDILAGRKPLSTVMCLKLSRLFGGTPQLWMRLQAAYDLKKVIKTRMSWNASRASCLLSRSKKSGPETGPSWRRPAISVRPSLYPVLQGLPAGVNAIAAGAHFKFVDRKSVV